jgi:hypothetical protein
MLFFLIVNNSANSTNAVTGGLGASYLYLTDDKLLYTSLCSELIKHSLLNYAIIEKWYNTRC